MIIQYYSNMKWYDEICKQFNNDDYDDDDDDNNQNHENSNSQNLRERDHWGDPGADGRIILRWTFRKWDVGVWTGSSWLRTGTGGGHL